MTYWHDNKNAGFQRSLLISMAGMLGLMPLAILPLYIGGLVDLKGLSFEDAGLLSSVNLLGNAIGVLWVSLLARHNKLFYLALAVTLEVTFDVLSIYLSDQGLVIFRALSGLGGGIITGMAFQMLAKQKDPDRGFAVLICLQFLIGGVSLYFVPMLQEQFGIAAFYLILIFFAIVSGLCGLLVFGRVESQGSDIAASGKIPRLKIIAVLSGIACFELAAAGVWAFAERIGDFWGLANTEISTALAIATLAGIVGSLLVIFLGTKFGRGISLIFGCGLVTASLIPLTFGIGSYAIYLASLLVFNLAWAYTIPYLQGLQAALDDTGRLAVFGMGVVLLSIALGPYLFSLIISTDDFSAGIYTSIFLFLLVVILSGGVARNVDQQD